MSTLARSKRSLPALPSLAAKELTALERDFGGRAALVQALVLAPHTADLRYLLGILGDPDNDPKSLAECLSIGKILPGQLLDALTKGTTARSQLLARQAIARRTPTVVTEVMEKAAEFEADCPDCQGLGRQTPEPSDVDPNPVPLMCASCQGHGRLRYDADPHCRDLALEMAGLTGKGGGVTVQTAVQVNVPGGSFASGYEKMQEAVDTILYGDRGASLAPESAPAASPLHTIDAEVLDTPPSPPVDFSPGDDPRADGPLQAAEHDR